MFKFSSPKIKRLHKLPKFIIFYLTQYSNKQIFYFDFEKQNKIVTNSVTANTRI